MSYRCWQKRILHVAQSTAAEIISRLEQKGLAAGLGDAEEQLLSNLTEAERDIFYMLLKKVRDAL